MDAFTSGPEGALVEWLQPYDGLSDSSLTDVPRQLGLLRHVRPRPTAQPARADVLLPWASDCTGEPLQTWLHRSISLICLDPDLSLRNTAAAATCPGLPVLPTHAIVP